MSNLDADGNPQPVTGGHGSQAVDWHQDDSYTNRPAQGALLYNVAHPVDGGLASLAARRRHLSNFEVFGDAPVDKS